MQLPDPFGWVGSTIDGQFAVEAIAGQGGFAIVYRGTHLGLEAPIAIKCLLVPAHLSEAERASLLTKFRAEAQLLHRLSRQTASIVQALSVGAATAPNGQWTPYIVMEWLEGQTLDSDLRARRETGLLPRGLDEAMQLLAPAVDALTIAHEDNVSHRDVKPANLFLTPMRGGVALKVLDFGIAKVFSETPSFTEALQKTSESHRALTPTYAAPEQFSLDFGATGPWTDVFAMALIVIEVASGRRALTGETLVNFFMSSIEAHRQPEILEGVTLPDSPIASVLRRALDPSPASRFRSMGEFWSHLVEARRRTSAEAQPKIVPHPRAPLLSTAEVDADTRSTERDRGTQSALVVSGENRICTAIVADLSSVAGLLSRLDAEEVKEITDQCIKAVAEQVEGLGGVIERSTGDRVIAVYGVLRSTDNDAERAVTTALRVQLALRRVALPRAARTVRLSASIGISTGRVFARMVTGVRGEELTIAGEAIGSATRLLSSASAGEIVIGRDTYRQVVGRFSVEPLAPIVVPGRAEALPCYRVKSAIAFQASFAPMDFQGLETKFVDRAAEKQRAVDALETVLSEGRARMLTLLGPPGVGRSRLLAELFASLIGRKEGVLVLSGQCSPFAENTAYGLAAALLRQRFDIQDADKPQKVARKLRAGLRFLRSRSARNHRSEKLDFSRARDLEEELDPAELEAALGQIEGILGVPGKAAAVVDSITRDESGRLAKQRIAAAVALLVRFAARCLPVILLCDDLQWADDASLDLLDFILRRGEDLPVLILGGARTELLERRPEWGKGGEAYARVEVGPLARRHVEEIIKDRLRRIQNLSPDIVRMLSERAEGNPLILEETLHLLVDAGVIEVRGEQPWMVREERLGALALPPTIQGIVQSRLDRLDPAMRLALAQAAIVGRTFWYGAVEYLQRASPQGAPEAVVAGLFEQLSQRQLIRLQDKAALMGEREAMFAESATHEVAYEMLSAKIRRPLHLLAAGWLEARVTPGAGAALLALHYDQGGDLARAALAYVRAAAHAASLGENAEALRHLSRARAIHDDTRGDEPRSSVPLWDGENRRVASHHDRVRLRLELGDVLRRMGKLEEAERAYEEAKARVLREERREGHSFSAAEALLWDARVDARLALVHKVRGSYPEALALIERAIARATDAGALEETPAMYALLVFMLHRNRRPAESWQAACKGLRVCRTMSRRDERWRESVAQILLGVALSLYGRGRPVSAERTYRQVSRLLPESTHPHVVGAALNGVAGMRIARGELRGVRELLLRSVRFKERAGDLHQIAVGYSNLAEVELRLKEAPAALDHARRAVRLGEQSRAGSDLADMYKNLAEAESAAGDIKAALDAGQKSLALAESRGRLYLGHVALTLARVIVRAVELTAADASLEGEARAAAETLRASLAKKLEDKELLRSAEECRLLLSKVGIEV